VANHIHIELKGTPPSKKNSKRIMRTRAGRMLVLPSKSHENWHAEQQYELLRQWPRGVRIEKVLKMTQTFYAKDRRPHDLSNKVESVNDLLVDMGCIADDNWFVLPDVQATFHSIEKENPRVIIDILY
jgi:Holliday junction resolvase RusA-like endonuclease